LTNVAKHAQAEQVVVSLSATAHEIHLSVVDDGRGIRRDEGRDVPPGDGGPATGTGYGLGNLRDRARACGGHVSIGPPASGRGTEISWRVPVRS
jgi:signal transduction histidine kinase